jgi:hypothetical protein
VLLEFQIKVVGRILPLIKRFSLVGNSEKTYGARISNLSKYFTEKITAGKTTSLENVNPRAWDTGAREFKVTGLNSRH